LIFYENKYTRDIYFFFCTNILLYLFKSVRNEKKMELFMWDIFYCYIGRNAPAQLQVIVRANYIRSPIQSFRALAAPAIFFIYLNGYTRTHIRAALYILFVGIRPSTRLNSNSEYLLLGTGRLWNIGEIGVLVYNASLGFRSRRRGTQSSCLV